VTIVSLARYATIGMAGYELDDVVALILGVGAIVVVTQLAGRLGAPRAARVALASVLVLAICAALAAHRDKHRLAALREARFIHSVVRFWAEPARILDRPRSPQVIAVTHGHTELLDHGLFYFLFGRELQNRLVYVPPTRDGHRVFNPWNHLIELSYDVWLARLVELGVHYVVAFDRGSAEQAWMEDHPERFQRVWGVPKIRGLYKVLPETP
jgi:hypothetical protein